MSSSVLVVSSRCRLAEVVWPAWLAGLLVAFGVAEWRAYVTECHPTLSRVLARIPGSPVLLAAGGALLAIHIRQVQKESSCPLSNSG